jgi:hypothetical protein
MPIKPLRLEFTPHAPDADGICAAQQTAGAADLVLDGVDVGSDGVARFAAADDYGNVGYQVGLASTGNLSGVSFTVVGTDANGDALSETLAGPNNNTVETAGYFKTVTSVSVDGAVGTDVTVGTVDEFTTKPIVVDLYCGQTTLAVDISGTINYTAQACYERVTAGQSPNWGDAIAAGAVDGSVVIDGSIGAIRIVGNSFTGGATVGVNINQPRYN